MEFDFSLLTCEHNFSVNYLLGLESDLGLHMQAKYVINVLNK